MSKIIIFLGIWLALLTGCASPADNESAGMATAVLIPTTSSSPTSVTAAVTPTHVEPTAVGETPISPSPISSEISATATSTLTIALTPVPAETGETWVRYANETYGFAFAFPPEWELVEGQNHLRLNYLPQPQIKFVIGFKWFDDQQTAITRSGVAAGELTTEGVTQLLGQEIDRNILRYEGRDKAILYNNAAPVRAHDLLFTLSLDDFSTPYETAELTPEIMQMADAIVASFELIDRLYVNHTYDFSFVVPPEWRLRPAKVYGTPDDQNALKLTYRPDRTNSIVLSIGFKRQDEEDIRIVRTGVPEMDEAVTSEISFMGRSIGRDVLRYEGKNKMILYHGGGPIQINDLIFTLSLDYFGLNYSAFAMPAEVMEMADEIVQSFALVGE